LSYEVKTKQIAFVNRNCSALAALYIFLANTSASLQVERVCFDGRTRASSLMHTSTRRESAVAQFLSASLYVTVGWLVGWLVVGCHARALWPNGAS